jgi:hypothetical protein
MVEEIAGPGHESLDQVSRSDRARIDKAEKADDAARDNQEPEVEVTSELRELIERVKQADTYRKERIHQVLEKLQRGELITSETVRETAERIIREGI